MKKKRLIILNKTKDAYRGRAAIYAALANVSTVSAFAKWQIEKLIYEATMTDIDLSIRNLRAVHFWAHYLINERLDHGKVDVRQFVKNLPQPTVLEGGDDWMTIHFDFDLSIDDDPKSVFLDLWNIVRLPLFPFKRCQVCRAIFVIAGKKKFCSSKCAALSLGPRTEYMRKHMRKIRAKAKKKREQEKHGN